MPREQGAKTELAMAFETTYGTSPGSGFIKVPFVTTTLGSEQPLIDSDLLGYGRDPLAPIKDAVTADGNVVVPIDLRSFGYWLKGAFGAPTTTGTDPYTHVFKSGLYALPSMSIQKAMPTVPSFQMVAGCKVNQIQWTMQRSGQLTATVGLIAQGETLNGANQAGTPAAIAIERFGHFNGSVSREGSALANITQAEITYTNNLDPVETIRSDGKIDGVDEGMGKASGRLTTRFADTTLLTQAINGAACELEFAYSLGAGKTLTLTAHEVYLPRPRIEISGPGGIEAQFDWQAALNASAGCALTVTLVNDVETY